MYYKWNLRSTCNTILDYSVHTRNMSRDEAMNLLITEAFQQKTEAENKWRRVSLTQVQLSIPVAAGALVLGTWQGIYVFEHRRRPHTREIVLHLLGD